MTKAQKIICYSLLFSGVLLYPTIRMVGYRNFAIALIGFALIAIGGVYGLIVLWRAKRFDQLKRAAYSFGVMVTTLFLLYLIWG